jgi:hypothetical protein
MVYGLRVARIPTNRPLIRTASAWPRSDHARREIPGDIKAGRGSDGDGKAGSYRHSLPGGVGESQRGLQRGRGSPTRVLNAKFDREEASIVAEAGKARAVTIATNMAGRGTDIKLGEGCAGDRRSARDRERIPRRGTHRPAAHPEDAPDRAIREASNSTIRPRTRCWKGNRAGLARWAVKLYPAKRPSVGVRG